MDGESTVGEINAGLSRLGYTSKEQLHYAELVSTAHLDGVQLGGQTPVARAHRASLLRDWFQDVFEMYKTRHASDSDCLFYCRPRYPHLEEGYLPSDGTGVVFEELSYADMKARITKVHIALFRKYTASADLSESVRTVMASITDLIDEPDERYIYIGMGYAVDRGELVPEDGVYKGDFKIVDLNKCFDESGQELVEPIPLVFYRLFDTPQKDLKADNDMVRVPPLTKQMVNLLKRDYRATLRWLHTSETPERRPAIPNKLDEIDQWACGFDDRYRDIIHMAASKLKKHDYGIYFLTGRGRNGKSSCIDLIASMYGTRNICRVSVDDLGDNHNLSNFKRALVNLPDEQKLQNEASRVMSSEAVKAFRIAAAHSSDNMSVMRSNKSETISYGFTTIAPVNRLPNFPSEEKAACIDRCRIIDFQGNFSASDKLAVKWGKQHFTSEFMMRFTGQVLAYAEYYSVHPWVMTPMMTTEQAKQYENSAANVTFMKMWERIFCGFDSYRTLFDDYENYCTLMDVEKAEFGRNSILLVQYNLTGNGTDKLVGKFRYHYNRFLKDKMAPRLSKEASNGAPGIMYKRLIYNVKDPDNEGKIIQITKGKTIEDFHRDGGSIIFELEDRGYFKKLDEQDNQLRLGGIDGDS